MRRILIIILVFPIFLFAQHQGEIQKITISKKDSLRLVNLPEVRMTYNYTKNITILPYQVDNSEHPYWREIYWQSGCSCGQASSEGYVFTYEINRKRGLDATVDANRYPYSFTYNFLNIGNTVCGASFLESQDIIREAGIPNLPTNGGVMTDGGMKKWLNGYDKYYAAMQNRINNVKAIRIGTPEGLEVLKHYLHDHLEGSPYGGMAFFYANHVYEPEVIPAGTPEAGKHIITSFSNTSHAMSIIGYNDSVRYDYNNDGQYTNDIDITGDGIVDMRDWEIGAFKIVNTYNGGSSPIVWADQGFCYVMYRILPYRNSNGGVWDKTAYITDVKETYSPLLTAKVNLTYDNRNKIKIMAGVSTNLSATFPEHIEEFPMFRFHGHTLFMQGGTDVSDKTIEIGLDLTELLNFVDSNQAAKYFLYIKEEDPADEGTGTINSFSIIDYTNGVNEFTSSQTNISITDNGNTLLSVDATINYNNVEITTDTIPRADLNTSYTIQIEAEGGTEPYKWYPLYNYKTTTIANTFVPLTGSTLPGGFSDVAIEFEFPFYGQKYDTLTVSNLGALLFDAENVSVPYDKDYSVLHRYFKSIAPFFGRYSSVGIRYEGDSNHAKFYWNTTFSGINIKFMITLFPDGTIYIDYGDNTTPDNPEWAASIGKGDQINYQKFDFSGQTVPINTRLILEPRPFPVSLSVDDDGLISGTLTEEFMGDSLFVKVIDNNWLEHTKGFLFTDRGLLFSNYQITTLDNNVLEYGEIAQLSLDLSNVGEGSINNINLQLIDNDINYTLIDSLDTLNILNLGQTTTLTNAFEFQVSEQIQDNTLLTFIVNVTSDEVAASDTVSFVARAPKIDIINTEIIDGNNNILDPGETADLLIYYKNIGGSEGHNLIAQYTITDSYITINSISNETRTLLNPDSIWVVTINITSNASTPESTISTIESDIDGDFSFHSDNNIYVGIGLITETWESGTMDTYPWGISGSVDWFIQNTTVYQDTTAIQSGNIGHNQESVLSLTGTVASNGNISFYSKISSEETYDFLRFYIDSVMVGEWSGVIDWVEHSFPINAGLHKFEWKYEKDVNTVEGLDAAWVDYIIFPPIGFAEPVLEVSVNSITKTMHTNEVDTDTLYVTNIGGGLLTYSAEIDDATVSFSNLEPAPAESKSLDGSTLTSNPTSVYTGLPITINFTVTNASTDSEWIEKIIISFPLGVHLDSATNFIGGSGGPLEWDTIYGNGNDVSWFGENNDGWGLIHSNESATATFYLTIDEAIQNFIILQYQLVGDIYGAEPHTITDFLVLTNNGINDTWLTLDNISGNLVAEQDGTVLLNYNTFGIPLGTYNCNVKVATSIDSIIVPITLHVIDYVGIETVISECNIYPNPAKDYITIERTIATKETIKIFNATGKIMYNGVINKKQETIRITNFKPGIYLIAIIGDNGTVINKVTVY